IKIIYKTYKEEAILGNKKSKKSGMITEKLSREYDKVNMEAAEDMGMPGTDKKRKAGKGSAINQFR
ncbi:hypothetical protein, partial [Clostridium botulinum]|uniref:hypothetical protein n=1 Tax=Clostridium botulinum TaxID=1491 RepID=UPI001E501ECC